MPCTQTVSPASTPSSSAVFSLSTTLPWVKVRGLPPFCRVKYSVSFWGSWAATRVTLSSPAPAASSATVTVRV